MEFLNAYVSQDSSSVLKAGKCLVNLIAVGECTSFDDVVFKSGVGFVVTKHDGKDDVKWATPTRQIVFLAGNDSGSVTQRLAIDSFLLTENPEHYTSTMRADPRYTVVGRYVCYMKDGKLERMPNYDGMERCRRIIQSWLFAIAGGKPGVTGQEIVDTAIAKKTKFWALVENEVYQGKLQSKFNPDGYKPYVELNENESENEIDDDLKA